jgi:hypothetical protein
MSSNTNLKFPMSSWSRVVLEAPGLESGRSNVAGRDVRARRRKPDRTTRRALASRAIPSCPQGPMAKARRLAYGGHAVGP